MSDAAVTNSEAASISKDAPSPNGETTIVSNGGSASVSVETTRAKEAQHCIITLDLGAIQALEKADVGLQRTLVQLTNGENNNQFLGLAGLIEYQKQNVEGGSNLVLAEAVRVLSLEILKEVREYKNNFLKTVDSLSEDIRNFAFFLSRGGGDSKEIIDKKEFWKNIKLEDTVFYKLTNASVGVAELYYDNSESPKGEKPTKGSAPNTGSSTKLLGALRIGLKIVPFVDAIFAAFEWATETLFDTEGADTKLAQSKQSLLRLTLKDRNLLFSGRHKKPDGALTQAMTASHMRKQVKQTYEEYKADASEAAKAFEEYKQGLRIQANESTGDVQGTFWGDNIWTPEWQKLSQEIDEVLELEDHEEIEKALQALEEKYKNATDGKKEAVEDFIEGVRGDNYIFAQLLHANKKAGERLTEFYEKQKFVLMTPVEREKWRRSLWQDHQVELTEKEREAKETQTQIEESISEQKKPFLAITQHKISRLSYMRKNEDEKKYIDGVYNIVEGINRSKNPEELARYAEEYKKLIQGFDGDFIKNNSRLLVGDEWIDVNELILQATQESSGLNGLFNDLKKIKDDQQILQAAQERAKEQIRYARESMIFPPGYSIETGKRITDGGEEEKFNEESGAGDKITSSVPDDKDEPRLGADSRRGWLSQKELIQQVDVKITIDAPGIGTEEFAQKVGEAVKETVDQIFDDLKREQLNCDGQ